MSIDDAIAAAPYGRADRITPRVRRVLAKNPSAFTYLGTGTYIVGNDTVAVIDPGPDEDDHLAAILFATEGETVSHILVTHTHRDHSPLAVRLQQATGAQIAGCAELVLEDDGPRSDAAFDATYSPDRVLSDGESVSGPDWTLTAVHTPGHTSNHLCFALDEEQALFSGDHIMGWSTSVVSPPDGDMTAYLSSLKKLQQREETIYYPTHGDPVENPQKLVRGYLVHRRQRETQILKLLADGPREIPGMVAAMYAMVSKALHPAAGRSVLAHLIDLERRNLVERGEGAEWRLVA
jgi:glyoxylase-like metal-dependent hydrolase (beta-lactamase superfamily II)|tara:strand:+ start:51918 stop:52796 length:879 start_codon:yes stop_codon:yes gene_type:complete